MVDLGAIAGGVDAVNWRLQVLIHQNAAFDMQTRMNQELHVGDQAEEGANRPGLQGSGVGFHPDEILRSPDYTLELAAGDHLHALGSEPLRHLLT